MKNEIDINELREMLSNFLTLDQTERDALLMNLLNWLVEHVLALEAAQAETANMRNVITLQQGAIEDLLASVAMLNDEIASRPVAALEAAQPAPPPAPTVLYEGPAVVFHSSEDATWLDAPGILGLSENDRVHIVVTTAAEDDES